MLDNGYVEIAHGDRLFVRDWGSGPAGLFLAGWAMTSDLWAEVMIALNKAGKGTVAYDRRGHGPLDRSGRHQLRRAGR